MGSLDFEGMPVPFEEGDSIASALYRAGVRTFSRSLKYHRRRGLYCLTGDCPNCILTVDGEPGLRSCCTDARQDAHVERGEGWPSTEHDVLSVADHAHRLLPVGFYYKTFIKPRFAWPIAERVIRGVTGLGRLPLDRAPDIPVARHLHPEVLVIGGGVGGLAAARAAASDGRSVVICDEGRLGEKVAPGPTLDRIRMLDAEIRVLDRVTLLERHTAVGIYDGPLVAVSGPDALLRIRPGRVVVATGAVEAHGVFDGNDLPGVWLGRGAARLAGVHGLRPGDRSVVVANTAEGLDHARTLLDAGARVAIVAPGDLADRAPEEAHLIRDGELMAAHGSKRLIAVEIETDGKRKRYGCDALVLSLGLEPRDGLLRMAPELPVAGAGDVALPGCTLEEAEESGLRAARGESLAAGLAQAGEENGLPAAGYVCLCEDVAVGDLEQAWQEGWHSSEILKRYTTATMGPCQGAMCGRHLARFAAERSGSPATGARTTSRPPARPVRLDAIAAGVDEVIEKRTSLHDRHLQLGARLDWSGSWMRPYSYGDVAEEYRAVRERVSVMDVGTLGKFLVAGRDARELLDFVFPTRVEDLRDGRARYMLALDEAGYVMDDGLICAIGDSFYVTSTSGGADRMEAWLRNWADRLDLHVHLVNQTAVLGAILLAGPRARDVMRKLTTDRVDRDAFPYMALREITVGSVPCRALRVGFVGELGFELHHPRQRGPELWNELTEAGAEQDIRPHGLDALDVLRLEKGHIYLGQDTLPDDHPAKLGMEWAIASTKERFVGKVALERMAEFPLERKLVGLDFDHTPQRGAPLSVDGHVVGRITSCAQSGVLGRAIGLGWIRAMDGEFPSALRTGEATATVVPTPFYDPDGSRLRA
jgi:sarcosine oxidase, subunit alpha